MRYMGFPFTPFSCHGKSCSSATFLGVEHLFLCLQRQNQIQTHVVLWSFEGTLCFADL